MHIFVFITFLIDITQLFRKEMRQDGFQFSIDSWH